MSHILQFRTQKENCHSACMPCTGIGNRDGVGAGSFCNGAVKLGPGTIDRMGRDQQR